MNSEMDEPKEATSAETEITIAVEPVEEVTEATSASDETADTSSVEVPKEFNDKVEKALGKTPKEDSKPEDDSVVDEPEKSKEKESDVLSQEKEEKVPENLTQRPEWQSLTKIADKVGKNEGKEVRRVLRGFYKREYDYQQSVERLKPAQEVVQEMVQAVQGDEQGFKNMRTLIRSYEGEPDKAIPMLKMLLEDCEKRSGLVIQSDDLKQKVQEIDQLVKDNLITLEAAEQRKQELIEVEKSRATVKRVTTQTENRSKQIEQSETQKRQREQLEQLAQVENNWMADKKKSDPDFAMIEDLFSVYVRDLTNKFTAEHEMKWPDAKESQQILEEALKSAKGQVLKYKPKPQAKIAINGNGNGSSVNHKPEPKTAFERFEANVDRALTRRR